MGGTETIHRDRLALPFAPEQQGERKQCHDGEPCRQPLVGEAPYHCGRTLSLGIERHLPSSSFASHGIGDKCHLAQLLITEMSAQGLVTHSDSHHLALCAGDATVGAYRVLAHCFHTLLVDGPGESLLQVTLDVSLCLAIAPIACCHGSEAKHYKYKYRQFFNIVISYKSDVIHTSARQ